MLSFLIVVFSTTQVEVLIKNTSDQNRAQSLVFFKMMIEEDVSNHSFVDINIEL